MTAAGQLGDAMPVELAAAPGPTFCAKSRWCIQASRAARGYLYPKLPPPLPHLSISRIIALVRNSLSCTIARGHGLAVYGMRGRDYIKVSQYTSFLPACHVVYDDYSIRILQFVRTFRGAQGDIFTFVFLSDTTTSHFISAKSRAVMQ